MIVDRFRSPPRPLVKKRLDGRRGHSLHGTPGIGHIDDLPLLLFPYLLEQKVVVSRYDMADPTGKPPCCMKSVQPEGEIVGIRIYREPRSYCCRGNNSVREKVK